MSIRSKAIKLAYERPELRSKLLPLIKAAKDKATTPEGAKKLHKQYMEKHPDSKKKPQDFYEKSDEKGGEMPKSLKDSALPQSIKDGAKPASEKEAKEWQAEKKADLKTPEGQKALGEAEAALNDGELDDRGLFAGLGGVVGMGAGTVTMVAAGATGIGFIALPILGGAVAIGATIGAIAGAVSNRRKKNEDEDEGTKKAAADSRKELERLFTAPTMKDVEAAAPFLDDKGHLDEDKVLKALKGARAKESSKTAGNGHEVLWWLLDQRDFFKMYRTVEKQDKQSAQLLKDITDKLADSLKIKDNEYNAISRLTQLVKGGQNWDISLQRNNIFKVADLMGIKLPSGMFASQKTASQGPNSTGRGWLSSLSPNRWIWSDRAAGASFTVTEKEGPGQPIFTLHVLIDQGVFKHVKPSQWKDKKDAFKAAAKWYKALVGEEVSKDLRTNWSKTADVQKTAAHKTAAGLNDLPKVFADMSAMTEGDYEIAMKHRQLKWRSNQWTDVSTWQKAAKAAMPFGYGDFNADKVGRWLKKYEKMGNLEIQAAREYSVALYIRSDNPDLLLQIEKAGRGSSAKVDESDIRKDGTLRLWWD